MGRIAGPYGVLGWVKVQTFTEHLDTLLDHPHWLVGESDAWQEMHVEEGRVHSDHVIARLAGVHDRDAAFRLKGREVAVAREALPSPAADEVYWADLVGLAVENTTGERLGTVSEVFSNGSHPILRVREDAADGAQAGTERLIPFVAAYVKETDVGAGTIRVEWEREW
jgi:16S rRNA processing protein RimM